MATQTVDTQEWAQIKLDRDYLLQSLPKYYRNGALQQGVKIFVGNAPTASGQVVFNLTDDGTPEGAPIFTEEVYEDGIAVAFNDQDASRTWEVVSISPDLKTLTISVQEVSTVLLGIVQFAVPTDGVTISAIVHGK